ncbi:hypothetical protein [Micromonospora sp. WMMD1082]|uniref:hypothetical protein n=1 Tax=Micromonospora sp. WMMD1082 TaxID=3016104 RepID=UPI0024174884|nr:hypothetical protein [Micromonospora sp. WMMD1082]MDG4795212.1 hypothetical protein [Micromonospora sp. WMMD1082]
MPVIEDGEIVGAREPNFVELEYFHRHYGPIARKAAELRASLFRNPPREQPPAG